MILTQSLALKLSRLFSGIIILISLVAFSGSLSTNTDTRKTANRETLAKRNPAGKRSISLQQARQQLITSGFFHKSSLVSVINSLSLVDRLLQTRLHVHEKEKPDPLEITHTLKLHAPRNAGDLPSFS